MDQPEVSGTISVPLSPEELRYLVACGVALAQNVPEHSLPIYTGFSKEQIAAFSLRIRQLMEARGIDM